MGEVVHGKAGEPNCRNVMMQIARPEQKQEKTNNVLSKEVELRGRVLLLPLFHYYHGDQNR